MSEPVPEYTTEPPAPPVAVVVVAPPGLTEELRAYLSLRRDALIQELRALDRVLGRPQTVPTRQR